MNPLILDAGLVAVVDFVRETHAPIEQAFTTHKPVEAYDFAALAGAVGALLDAIDARRVDNQQATAVTA